MSPERTSTQKFITFIKTYQVIIYTVSRGDAVGGTID
jgi:hypothetical protein